MTWQITQQQTFPSACIYNAKILALPLVSDIIDNAGDLALIKMEVTPSAYECAGSILPTNLYNRLIGSQNTLDIVWRQHPNDRMRYLAGVECRLIAWQRNHAQRLSW